jgi:ammonia channel protein AmtB
MPKLPSGAVCQNIVPFVAGMTIDCASKDLLVTGYGFNTSTVWNVQGPNAIAVPVTNVSILDGAARLHITDWPGSGKYCITATNPPPGNCNGLVYF